MDQLEREGLVDEVGGAGAGGEAGALWRAAQPIQGIRISAKVTPMP